MTRSDRVLRTARAVLRGRPGRTLDLLNDAMQTRDPRLRRRMRPALTALNRGYLVAPDKWSERGRLRAVAALSLGVGDLLTITLAYVDIRLDLAPLVEP